MDENVEYITVISVTILGLGSVLTCLCCLCVKEIKKILAHRALREENDNVYNIV